MEVGLFIREVQLTFSFEEGVEVGSTAIKILRCVQSQIPSTGPSFILLYGIYHCTMAILE